MAHPIAATVLLVGMASLGFVVGYILGAINEERKLHSALLTARQALMEVRHAQEVGANWYTRGESGLYQQVRMWVDRGLQQIKEGLRNERSDSLR